MAMTSNTLRVSMQVRLTRLLATLCLMAGGDVRFAAAEASVAPGSPPLRLAISENVVRGINLNDARAALSIWSTELAKAAGLNLAIGQDWVMTRDQLQSAIRGGTADMFCLTVQDYRRVAAYVDITRVLTDDHAGEQFVLLVREGSGIVKLADLRGKSLIVHDSPSASLAEPWLSVSLWREGLDSPEQLFGRVTRNTKLSQAVLPVFFGQTDACLIAQRGLDTMSELNPQLAKRLKVLLASPKLVSTFFAWRQDYPASVKKPIFDRLLDLKMSPAATQVLTLFQSSGFAGRDGECLRPALALLDAYEHHRSSTAAARAR